MYHCCLDLELEQPKTHHQTPDSVLDEARIIQVGYVVYCLEPQFEIVEQVCELVDIGVPLSKFIQNLTGIASTEGGTTLEDVYVGLVQNQAKYGFSRIIKQWGGGDMDHIRSELDPEVNWQFGQSGCNIKHIFQMYAEANGIKPSGGLGKSMSKVGLDWKGGKAHNALTDAMNTAIMHNFLYRSMRSNV